MGFDTMKYYVYRVLLEGEVVYVGKGSGNRVNHVLSGCSHNSKINEAYFRNKLLGEPAMTVEIVEYFTTSKEALKAESVLVKTLNPDYNIFRCTDAEALSLTKDITNYEDFVYYIKGCYQDYSEQSSSNKPHNLKWYVYSKLNSPVWSKYSSFLEKCYEELVDSTDDLRSSNKGRPRKSIPDMLKMTGIERSAFYYYQRKVCKKFSVYSEEDVTVAEQWLENKRKSFPNWVQLL